MFEKQDNKLFVRADLLLAIVIAVCATVLIMHLTSSEPEKKDSIVKWGQVDDSPGYLDAAERRRMNRIFGP